MPARFLLNIFLGVAAFIALTAGLSAQAFEQQSLVYIKCERDGQVVYGTGVLIDQEGRVLTAKHVVTGTDKDISIDMADAECRATVGRQDIEPNRQIGLVKFDDNDAALLKLIKQDTDEFLPVSYRDIVDSMKDMKIYAVGFSPSFQGPYQMRDGKIDSIESEDGLFDTSAKTTGGMSGSPVFLEGALIGIVAGASWDNNGQVINYKVLAIEEISADIKSRMRKFSVGGDVEAPITEEAFKLLFEPDNLCTNLLREQLQIKWALYPDLPPDFLGDVLGTERPVFRGELAGTSEYWVTITTGPALWVNCDSPGTTRTSMYFPLGLMLRPEREINVGDDRMTMFQTEHGLRVLIDRSAVAPVNAENSYVFAENSALFTVCTKVDCNPGEELVLESTGKTWPYLTGYSSYLWTDDVVDLDAANEDLEDFIEYHEEIQADPTLLDDPSIDHRRPVKLQDDPACKERYARFYKSYRRYDANKPDQLAKGHYGSEFFKKVMYSLCSTTPNGVIPRANIKVVTPKIAKQRFDKLWATQTMRKAPQNILDAAKVLGGPDLEIKGFFDCGEPRDQHRSLGGGLKKFRQLRAPGEKSVLNAMVANDATIDALERTNLSSESNVRSRFRQFQMDPSANDREILRRTPIFADIEVALFCYDNNVNTVNGGYIRIDLEPLSDGQPIELAIDDLYQDYRELHGNTGMDDAAQLRDMLNEGFIFRICEYPHYVRWSDVLFYRLINLEAIKSAASKLNVGPETMTRYVTHLLFASVFKTDVRMRTAKRRGNCKTNRI